MDKAPKIWDLNGSHLVNANEASMDVLHSSLIDIWTAITNIESRAASLVPEHNTNAQNWAS